MWTLASITQEGGGKLPSFDSASRFGRRRAAIPGTLANGIPAISHIKSRKNNRGLLLMLFIDLTAFSNSKWLFVESDKIYSYSDFSSYI